MGDRLAPRVEIEELAMRFEQNLATWLESFSELLGVGNRDSLEILLEKEGQPVAEVDVLTTAIPGLEVHVLHYQNPVLGTRYDLVRSAPSVLK